MYLLSMNHWVVRYNLTAWRLLTRWIERLNYPTLTSEWLIKTRVSKKSRVDISTVSRGCERVVQCCTITMVRAILQKIALYAIIIAACIKKKNKRSRRHIWCREWLQRRETMGSSVTNLRELQDESEHLFCSYMRMNMNTFYVLLSKVETYIEARHKYKDKHVGFWGNLFFFTSLSLLFIVCAICFNAMARLFLVL